MIDRIGRDSFFTISHWMVSELELDGTELLVYALIFNLSFFGNKKGFYGSQEVLRSWVGAKSRTTVIKALSSLVEKNLIIKSDIYDNYGNKYCQYYAKKYNDETIYLENVHRETDTIITKYCQKNNLSVKNLKIELFYKNYIDVDSLEIIKENADFFNKDFPDLYLEIQNSLYIPINEISSNQEESDTPVQNLYTPCTETVHPPVQNLYNSCTETVHNINNNKFNINSTSTLKELSPKESAAVEFKHLLQKLFDNSELPFSENFYTELYEGLSKLYITETEYGVYLKWAYDECVKHNPRDIYDYFYKTATKIYFIAKYKTKINSESDTTEDKNLEKVVTKCPVCSGEVKISAEECPNCSFPYMNFNNQKEIENHKIFFKLPDNLKHNIKMELDNVYFDIHNLAKYEQDKQEIYNKYKKLAG